MPANPKYLTHSGWQRFGKVTAAILGSFMVTMSLHVALGAWLSLPHVIMTAAFSAFLMWATLMATTFLAKSALRIWIVYLLLTGLFVALAWAGLHFNAV